MGYRNYLAPIAKIEYERIKNFTIEELYKDRNEPMPEDDGYVGVYNITGDAIYELGKYVDSFDSGLLKPVFLNEELQKHMTDEHDFYLVGKEFIKAIIDRYNGKIKDYYTKMCTPFYGKRFESSEFMKSIKKEFNDESEDLEYNYTFDWSKITQTEMNALYSMMEHVRSMSVEWNRLTPYDLDKGDAVTTSWKYEYEQFELVRLYKHFDWTNNHMVYYGY